MILYDPSISIMCSTRFIQIDYLISILYQILLFRRCYSNYHFIFNWWMYKQCRPGRCVCVRHGAKDKHRLQGRNLYAAWCEEETMQLWGMLHHKSSSDWCCVFEVCGKGQTVLHWRMHEPCSKRRIVHKTLRINQTQEDRRIHKTLHQRRSVHKTWSKEETMQQGRMPNQSLKGWRSVQKAWQNENALPMDVRIKGRTIGRSVVQYHGRCPVWGKSIGASANIIIRE